MLAKALAIGEPNSLLRHRPDVRAAERRLAASTANEAVAAADLYPHITIGGLLGLVAGRGNPFDVVNTRAWAVTPALSWAAFDLGSARARLRGVEGVTRESVAEFEKIETDESPLKSGQFLKVDPAKTAPWKSIMLRNTPGQAPTGAPVFIAQGTADTTVEPAITKRFGEALCAQGVRVSFVPLPGVTHTFAARDSADAALNWMTERFRGAPAPSRAARAWPSRPICSSPPASSSSTRPTAARTPGSTAATRSSRSSRPRSTGSTAS